MAEPEVIGRHAAPVRAREIVTGRARYSPDLRFPGMLVGKLLYAAHPVARIRGLDVSAARSIPGVAAILTAQDIPGENSYLYAFPDQPLLVSDMVRYQGDALAAVAAESEEAALAALAAIQVDYEPLPGVFDVLEAMEPGARAVWEGRSNIIDRLIIRRGDIELGFREADLIIENTYRTPWQEHAFLETESATALVDGEGTLVVYASCQAPHRDRLQIARSLALPESKVRVIQPHVGGAFGGKDEAHVQIHAALLAHATGRPVNVTRTREESLLVHVKRLPFVITYKTGMRKNGRITAVQARIVGDSGPYINAATEVVGCAAEMAGGPYHVPHASFEGITVYTNNPLSGAFRGFGVPQVCFACECQMDEAAHALGMDPLAIRLINGLETGALLPSGSTVRQGAGMKASLREAARLAGWGSHSPAERTPAPHLRRGWGIGANMMPIGIGRNLPDHAGVILDMGQDGSVLLRTGAADMGQGAHTVLAQLAAEALGVELSAVRVLGPDTDATPDANASVASRQTFVSGNAVLRAAAPIRDALLDTAAEMGYPREVLSLRGGRLHVEGEEVNVTIAALAAKAWFANRPLHADGFYAMEYPETFPEDAYPYGHQAFAFGTQIAQVLVDIETGQVTVEKLFAAQNVGRVLNPDGAQGQVAGAAGQGLGYGIMEELLVAEGRTQNPDLHSYLIPTARDMPELTIALLEEREPCGPYGATGMGESPICQPAPAIRNAIADAIGARLFEIPMVAERVLAAVRSASAAVGQDSGHAGE